MLTFLFRRLTDPESGGAALFESATAIARRPHWFIEGRVPDTLEGRFALLASVLALVLVRLEAEGDEGDVLAVALTERFIAVMEAEHREMGLGDPALGRTVRKLVGALEWRTDAWRLAVARERGWATSTQDSLFKGKIAPAAVEHCAEALRRLWATLGERSLAQLDEGDIA